MSFKPLLFTIININKNYTLNVNNTEIEYKNFVKLKGIEIDNELLFDKLVASLCKKPR